jgi:hypothetical protein
MSNSILLAKRRHCPVILSWCDMFTTHKNTLQAAYRIFGRVRKIARTDYLLRHVCPSAWNNLVPTGRIFMRFDI